MRRNFCPLPGRPRSCVTRRRQASGILPIALALVLLPAIAFASPPDPSWILGIYDGADGDDIVTRIAETAAANTSFLVQIPPSLRLTEIQHGLAPGILQGFQRGQQPRGPPSTRGYIYTGGHTLRVRPALQAHCICAVNTPVVRA